MTVAANTPVSAALAAFVRRGTLSADPLQSAAARTLDRIATELSRPARLFSRRKPVRGAYLVGSVGRGKTMLMDVFFAAVPIAEKRRVHFDEFMDELHAAITDYRKSGSGDPIAAVTKPIIESTRLLCLDEFQVTDITNAMLLGRLFEKLFAAGVTLVATSNTLPSDLYRDGLNRQLFLPFIDLLSQQVDIVTLDGPTDYRRLKFEGEAVYQFGTGPAVSDAMDRLWLKLTGGISGQTETIRSLGRDIAVPLAAMGAARFPFAALCDSPLGARDYLRLAHAYETLMIDGVPAFGPANPSAAKRFILLVDTLYDRGIKLSASFAVPLEQLAAGSRNAHEFQRTLSRLVEMQSAAYLEAAHKPVTPTKG
ncbi:MAG: cell division protein ZapE [Hyphomicrobiales bacterium]|nr:MAG: cell division protein ZapE [Hyphomicrobiales bacterium]